MQLDNPLIFEPKILFYCFVREFSKAAIDYFNYKPLSRSCNLPTNIRFLAS